VKTASTFVAALFLTGCCARPWNAVDMPETPDWQCRTGGEAGYDVYGWDCVSYEGADQHVVVSAWTASFSCEAPTVETAPCGDLTAIEEELAAELGEDCTPPPGTMTWD